MTRSTEDGKHEGWVAARFADGALSAGRSGQGLQIGYAGDGTEVTAEHRESPPQRTGIRRMERPQGSGSRYLHAAAPPGARRRAVAARGESAVPEDLSRAG